MGDIARSALGGAWTVLVGWLLPTALNVSMFVVAVWPSLRRASWSADLRSLELAPLSVGVLAVSVLLGLALNALQNPLYRVLEGYALWPSALAAHGCARRHRAKQDLQDRIALLRLERQERNRPLAPDDAARLTDLRANRRITRAAGKDRRRTAAQRALLRERLARFPVDDAQLAPTTLGNAIRRFEEYGYDRFRLDTQVMWNELTGMASEPVRRQVDLARANVDFFVALLYGHCAVILCAALALTTAGSDVPLLLTAIAVPGLLIPVWYRSAVSATDEWAAAVRGLVNTTRKPLAESLGLRLPGDLASERTMWALVSKMSRLPHHERAAELDPFRAGWREIPPEPATGSSTGTGT
ncbi:hypothetical protein ACFYYM_07605 [Streptomyces erythrochromogenes]|uniref:hypothetical protein n=1 Tax=Streptomyces erythrochromogenes TaxID=285574 RepID=UPI0036C3243E